MSKGFTLIEIIIAIAIIAALAGISAVSLGTTNRQEALHMEVGKVLSLLEQARAQTVSGKGGNAYGVHFEEDRAVLFSGSVYSASNSANIPQVLHKAVSISAITLVGGGSDVVFKKLTGETAQNGTVRLSVRNNANASSTITIAPTGIAYSN
ncbi:MAG: prepilin-type N-terminal cleavage/methylation domain-containing protein [bacterium]|nr:prepilin-type N-terminal cleavage/methylation domain-containing protein [bacterium]